MKLGMQVGLSPGHIVLDEDPAPLRNGPGYVASALGAVCSHPIGKVKVR